MRRIALMPSDPLAAAIRDYAAADVFIDDEWELPLSLTRNPDEAEGECSTVSRHFAAFLRERGFDAFDSGEEIFAGGRADRPDNPLRGSAHGPDDFGYHDRRRESCYPEHSATVVRQGERTVVVDWTAAQFGYVESWPLVTEFFSADFACRS